MTRSLSIASSSMQIVIGSTEAQRPMLLCESFGLAFFGFQVGIDLRDIWPNLAKISSGMKPILCNTATRRTVTPVPVMHGRPPCMPGRL